MSELRDARQGVLSFGCGVGGQARCPLLLLASHRCLFYGHPPYLPETLVLSPSPRPQILHPLRIGPWLLGAGPDGRDITGRGGGGRLGEGVTGPAQHLGELPPRPCFASESCLGREPRCWAPGAVAEGWP